MLQHSFLLAGTGSAGAATLTTEWVGPAFKTGAVRWCSSRLEQDDVSKPSQVDVQSRALPAYPWDSQVAFPVSDPSQNSRPAPRCHCRSRLSVFDALTGIAAGFPREQPPQST